MQSVNESPQVKTGTRSGPETVQIARLSNHYDFRYSEFAKGVNDRGRIIDISQGFTLNDPVDRYSNYHRFTVDFLEYRNTHFRCKECGKIFEDTPGQKFIYCPECKVKGKEKEALPTIAGYTGACYADEFKLDIDDDTDLNQALEAARKVIKVFENEYSLPGRNINIVFSGSKGFHIKVPSECFGGFEPSPELPAIHKAMALEFVAGIAKIDKAVYDKTRLFRLPDTINSKTGLYCVQLSYEELFNLSIEQIKNLAKSPRGYELVEDPDYCPALAELYQKHKEFVKGNQTAVKTFSENGDGKADIDPGSISPWQIDKANQYYDEALDRFKGKLFDALNEGHNRDGRKLGRHDILLKLANQLRGLKIPSDEEEKYLFKFREDSNAICKERGFDPGRDIPDDELKNMLNDVGVYQERNKKKKAAQEPGAGVFWEYVTVNAKGDLKLTINRSRFIEFLQRNGFYKTELNDKDYIFVRVDKNIVTEVRPVHIKNFVKQYIQSLKIPEAPEIETAILKGARQYFATDLIEFLDNIKIVFNRPDKITAFFYYRNCVAKVTGEKGIEVIQYSDLPGKIWRNQILDRDFKVIGFDGCEYERFINNVSGQAGQDKQPERKDAFTSAIGYLLHGFKHKPIAKAVICVDERIPRNDNEANGGTGKGIFFNAIAKLKNSVIKDGQTFKSDKTFLYQDVNLDTEILIIDDAKKSFPFHAVFSTITEDMPVEKKNRPLFIIPFERSPKMIITTNFTITGRGTSYERRKFEIEFADYYKANFTPYDEFKHTLFDDWSAEEWLKFDNFMLTCCWLYLKDGLIEYSRRNVAERTLIDDTHRDFVEFAKESLETGSFDRNELYDKFRKQYTDFNNDKFTTNTFRKWLTYYADFKNWHADFKRSNSKNYVAFTKKLPFPPGSA